jgi:hypothetical protein
MNVGREIELITTRVLVLLFFIAFCLLPYRSFCNSLTGLFRVFFILVYSALTIMALDTYAFSNLGLFDGRNFIGDVPHTPSTSQARFLNTNTPLHTDHIHDMHMSDSSPAVSNRNICVVAL